MQRLEVLEAQSKASAEAISDLAGSLGDAVERSLTKRMPPKISAARQEALQTGDVKRFMTKTDLVEHHESTKALVMGVADQLDKQIVSAAEMTASKFEPLLRGYDDIVDRRIDSKLAALKQEMVSHFEALTGSTPHLTCGQHSTDDETTSACHAAEEGFDFPVVVEEPCLPFGVGDYVRLKGLKSTMLNGSPGYIMDYLASSRRFGVLLHGSTAPKAIKPENLEPYAFIDGELCPKCYETLNLFSFPPCSCDLPKMNDFPSPSSIESWPDQ